MTICRWTMLRKRNYPCSEMFKTNGLAITKRHVFIFVAIGAIFLLMYSNVFLSRRSTTVDIERRPPFSGGRTDIEVGTILFWTTFFGQDFASNFGTTPFDSCPNKNCKITSDRRRLRQAQAVIFHIRDIDTSDMPSTDVGVRDPSQYWIFYLYESPAHTFTSLRPLNNIFNWTMTYRLNSDVAPDLRIEPKNRSNPDDERTVNHAADKTKMAAWIVSNCWTNSHREDYVRELRKFVDVDVFGDCGDDDNDACRKDTSMADCYGALERKYKFYLSFENSVCVDYVTEKWYNVVQYDILPIVYGGANYRRLAPPHSFIDVRDFEKPEHLARYLWLLDGNDTLYNEYFEWKRDFRVVGTQNSLCQLCGKLREAAANKHPSQSYVDVDNWWNNGGRCLDILQLYVVPGSKLSKHIDYVVDTLSWYFQYFLERLKSF